MLPVALLYQAAQTLHNRSQDLAMHVILDDNSFMLRSAAAATLVRTI